MDSAVEAMDISPLDEQEIRYRISLVTDIPPMPLALQRLADLIRSGIVSLKELESVIRYDQGLCARILRTANSAFYGCRGQTRTLEQALVLIGFEQAKRLCLCALLLELFSSGMALDPSEKERLWKHALATARIASEIIKNRPWTNPEEAYLLGLLHDIGQLVMAVYLPTHYWAIRNLAAHRNMFAWYVEREYGVSHNMIGKWVAVKWSLPEAYQRVAEYHHDPDKSPSCKSEVKVIHLANVLALSQESPALLTDVHALNCCRDLCIAEEGWSSCQERMDAIRSEVDHFWSLLK
jgi:HD-like signal output (HDOD) protein